MLLNPSHRLCRTFATGTSKSSYPRSYPSNSKVSSSKVSSSSSAPSNSSVYNRRAPAVSPPTSTSSSSPPGRRNPSSYTAKTATVTPTNRPPSSSAGYSYSRRTPPSTGGSSIGSSSSSSPSSSSFSSPASSLPGNALIIRTRDEGERFAKELNKLDPSVYTFAWRTEVADWNLGESTLQSSTVVSAALYYATIPPKTTTNVTSNRYRTTTTTIPTAEGTHSSLPSRVWIDNWGTQNSTNGLPLIDQPLQAFRSHFYPLHSESSPTTNAAVRQLITHSANFHIHALEKYFNQGSSNNSSSSSVISSLPYTGDTLRMGWLLGEKTLSLSTLTKHYNDNPLYQVPELIDVFGTVSPTNPRKKILPDVRLIQTNPQQRNAWINHSLRTIESTWYLYYKLLYNFERIAWNPDYRMSSIFYGSGNGSSGSSSTTTKVPNNRPTFSDCYRSFIHPATQTLMTLESNGIAINKEQVRTIQGLVEESIQVLQGTGTTGKGAAVVTPGKTMNTSSTAIPSYTAKNTFMSDDTFFTNTMGLDLDPSPNSGAPVTEGQTSSVLPAKAPSANLSSTPIASPHVSSTASNVFLRPAVLQRISEIYELVNNNPLPGLFVPKYGSRGNKYGGYGGTGKAPNPNQSYIQHLQQFTSSVLEPLLQKDGKERTTVAPASGSGSLFHFYPSYNPNTVNGRVLCARPFLLDRHLALETGILHSLVPSQPRNTFISLRYPYLDLTVMAHCSQSPSLWTMLDNVRTYEKINRTNTVITLEERINYLHRLTAEYLYGKEKVATNPSLYVSRARDINEGLPNGRTSYGLGKSWAAIGKGEDAKPTKQEGNRTGKGSVSTDPVQSFIDADHDIQAWFHQYPEIYPWIDTLTAQVERNQGILHTLGGRLRKLTLPKSKASVKGSTTGLSSFAQHSDDTIHHQMVQRMVLSSFISGSIADLSLTLLTRLTNNVYANDQLKYRPVFYGWDGIVWEGPKDKVDDMEAWLTQIGEHPWGKEEGGKGKERGYTNQDGIDKRALLVRVSKGEQGWWESMV